MSPTNWDQAQGLALEADGRNRRRGLGLRGQQLQPATSPWPATTVRASSTPASVARASCSPRWPPQQGQSGHPPCPWTDPRVPTVRLLVAGHANGTNSDFAVTRYWR